jgi:hypothetical protein
MVEVTGKKDDVTKDVQGIVSQVAGDVWDFARALLPLVKQHDPGRAEGLERAIEAYEAFMVDHESVVFS